MITHYFKPTDDSALEILNEPRSGVWTHVDSPTPEELAQLVEMYGLDEVILEDSGDVFEVPRLDRDGATTYFFIRYPFDVPDIDIDTAPMLIIIGETFMVTIANHDAPFLNPYLEDRRPYSTSQRTQFFFEILAELLVAYDRKLTHTRKLVYKDMGRVRSIRGRDIQRFVYFEQELNESISALIPTNAWLQQLTKGDCIRMTGDDRDLLDDLLITSSQLIGSAQSILKTIQNIRTASEAILTQSLNSTIRMLTAFTIILTIPTLIASLFGMNVPVPFAENRYGFWFVLVLIAIVIAITLHFFSKNRWI